MIEIVCFMLVSLINYFLLHSAVRSMICIICSVSVCPLQVGVKMAKDRITQMMLHNSPTVVFSYQRLVELPVGHTNVGRKNLRLFTNTRYILITVQQDRHSVSMKGEYLVVYAVSNCDIADDLEWP